MRKPLSKFQIICIVILWGLLCFLLVKGHGGFTAQAIFVMLVSGIIIFVPIYKKLRKR